MSSAPSASGSAEVTDPYLRAVLGRKLHRRDRPTDTHYTLEVAAYWRDDFIDAVRSGLRRRLTVGGLRSAGRANLAVELPPPLVPYTLAKISGPTAKIIYPKASMAALRTEDGAWSSSPPSEPQEAPFEALSYELGFGESFAFRVGSLTFCCRFVHRDGRARSPYDWIPALIFPGYMG